jgi:hypothetical protein
MTAPSILILIQKKRNISNSGTGSGISKGEHYLPKHLPSTTEEK